MAFISVDRYSEMHSQVPCTRCCEFYTEEWPLKQREIQYKLMAIDSNAILPVALLWPMPSRTTRDVNFVGTKGARHISCWQWIHTMYSLHVMKAYFRMDCLQTGFICSQSRWLNQLFTEVCAHWWKSGVCHDIYTFWQCAHSSITTPTWVTSDKNYNFCSLLFLWGEPR